MTLVQCVQFLYYRLYAVGKHSNTGTEFNLLLLNWFLKLSEEHRMFENRILRRISGPAKRKEAKDSCIMRSSTICTLHQILLG
jgi:hypothetical protein